MTGAKPMADINDRSAVEELLTADDVCALLKVKKSWLYDTVEQGHLKPIRLGKQLRFRPSTITRYLDSCEEQSNQRSNSGATA